MTKAKITGVGSYLPKKILTNADLEKMVDTSDEWIVSRTGIRERRIAGEDEYTSDMGYKAAIEAMKEADLQPNQIDLILVATLTSDYIFPSTACLIQAKLGAEQAASMDLQAACSGMIYGLSVAKAYIESGLYKNVLLIASEKLSSLVNYKDRSTCVLFGDGASACVISSEGKGLWVESVCLGSDGEQANLLILPAGGSKHPTTIKTVQEGLHYIHMEGREVFKHAVRTMQMASNQCLEKLHLKEEDISWVIPHQANERIIDAIAKRFEHLPPERIFKTVAKYGNTSASSVGIALDELLKTQKLCDQERILLTAFGSGFTWGAAILTNEGK